MATTLATIPDDVSKKYHSFKFRKSKGSCAIINKINSASGAVEIEQEIDNLDLDNLPNELSASEPRYVLISYEYRREDGRISYPYCLLFSSPRGSPNNLKMLYAGSLHHFAEKSEVTKVFELQDVDDFSEEWLIDELKSKGF